MRRAIEARTAVPHVCQGRPARIRPPRHERRSPRRPAERGRAAARPAPPNAVTAAAQTVRTDRLRSHTMLLVSNLRFRRLRWGDDQPRLASDATRGDGAASCVRAVKPQLRGWLHAGTFPGRPRRRHRPGRARPRHRARPLATGDLRRQRRAAVRRQRALPPRALVAAGRAAPQAPRPLEHLPDHRRHLHAVQRGPAPRRRRQRRCSGSCGPRRSAGIAFRVFWVGAPRWLYTPVYLGAGLGRGVLPAARSCTPAAPPSSRCSRSAAASTASAGSSTRSSSPTRHRAGSASTRSSTR